MGIVNIVKDMIFLNLITITNPINPTPTKNNKPTEGKTMTNKTKHTPTQRCNKCSSELLEALKQIIELVEQWRPDELDEEYLKDYDYILNKSREAIAKAEGR